MVNNSGLKLIMHLISFICIAVVGQILLIRLLKTVNYIKTIMNVFKYSRVAYI